MGLLDRLRGTSVTEDVSEPAPVPSELVTRSQLAQALRQEQNSNLQLQEAVSELELALSERGWDSIGPTESGSELTRAGLREAAAACRLTAIANPLVKRGVSLRTSYIWGLGVSIEARAKGKEAGEQDVNAVIQGFLDDPSNQGTWTGSQAREEKERALATDGNIFVSLWTSPRTGRVLVRTLPFEEVTDVVRNPEDRDEPWFYVREWNAQTVNQVTRQNETRPMIAFYPALDMAQGIPAASFRAFQPLAPVAMRQKPYEFTWNGKVGRVHWDAPVLHVKVNALDGWKFGLPDCYAVIAWSKAYKEFLYDWARLTKTLSRFAWKLTSKSKTSRDAAAAKIYAAPSTDASGQPNSAGAAFASDPSMSLDAIPKSGATIDSESGRPLAAMVAAGLGVPVTMLLGDPGTTGARATAETLDRPTELEMGSRRQLWTDVEQRILCHVIDQAVKAPQGPLRGTPTRDEFGREYVTLEGDDDGTQHTVDITWPPLEDTPVDVLVKAIVSADQTGKMPSELVFRLLAEALGVENVDEMIDELTDEDGNWIPQDIPDEQVRNKMIERGELTPPMGVDDQEPVGSYGGNSSDAG